jgi:hypothetical protein
MALIENLEHDDWQQFLGNCFCYALEVLSEDRHRPVGSSVDDLKSWLAAGGIARVREHLNEQMEMRRFSADRKTAVNDYLEQLVRENRGALLRLMADGIVAATRQEWLASGGLRELDFQSVLERIVAGERPFEEWMHAHGHSDEEIAQIYRVIDRWLIKNGIIPPQPSPPKMN